MFQSTYPVWDATGGLIGGNVGLRVSIHASRVGCDRIIPGAVARQ